MKRIGILTLLIFAATSCSELLVEKPRSITSPTMFFNTKEQVIAAVNGIYANFYPSDFLAIFEDFQEYGTDLMMPTRVVTRFVMQYYTVSETNIDRIPDLWKMMYKVIGDANLVIARIPDAPIDEATKNRCLGEAKFLRSLLYYWMSEFWGDLPMWLDELDINEVSVMGRTPLAEIRSQIVRDLEQAETLLPSTYPVNDRGRPTKWSAKALMVKLFLLQKDWAKAKEKAQDIIDNSPHRLLASYADVFADQNQFSDEIIFTIDFVQNIKRTRRHTRFAPRGVDEPKISGYDFTGYGNLAPTPEFAASFTEGDKRKEVNIITQIGSTKLNYIYMPKFWDIHAPRENSGQNYIVLRYADVLLMFAEAENELNGATSSALSRINAVRTRAGLPPLEGMTQAELRNAIMQERAWELAAEGHRRSDLIRWGKLEQAVKSVAASNPEGAANFKPHFARLPIPPDEIQKNPNLTQNDGY